MSISLYYQGVFIKNEISVNYYSIKDKFVILKVKELRRTGKVKIQISETVLWNTYQIIIKFTLYTKCFDSSTCQY